MRRFYFFALKKAMLKKHSPHEKSWIEEGRCTLQGAAPYFFEYIIIIKTNSYDKIMIL